MEANVYENIVVIVKNFRGLSLNCLKLLTEKFPDIQSNTLYSILFLEYQKRMKTNHVKSPHIINKYWELYQKAVRNGDNPGIILRIAEEFDICPCLIAKLILQKYFNNINSNNSSGISKNDDEQHQTKLINYLRDTTLIPDMDLAYEIYLCTLYDNLYSPAAETMKHSLGQEYEIKLYHEVVKLGLAFRDEEHLRKYGYDKTPDIKLEVPISVDGFVINWIESKALFGDEEAHAEYTKNQYLSYWNRFGPGLVIYWFGYPNTLTATVDERFIIKDHLPTNIIQINTAN